MFKQSGMFFNGLAWAPKAYDFETQVNQLINDKNLTGLSVIKGPDHIDGLDKPTYFKLNAFTYAYQ